MVDHQNSLEVKQPEFSSPTPTISKQQFFDVLTTIGEAISKTFGSYCEVVIHDFTDPESSIVGISGNLTNRKIGGSLNNLGLSILESGLTDENILTYSTQTPDGKPLKSTSVFFRNDEGKLIAALCINIDNQAIDQAAKILTELSKIPIIKGKQVEEYFSDDPIEVITGIFREEMTMRGLNIDEAHKLKREQRIDVIHALREKGIFNMRSAPSIVADLLGVSRFTVYNYINEIRSRNTSTE